MRGVVPHHGSRHKILGRFPGNYHPSGHECCSLAHRPPVFLSQYCDPRGNAVRPRSLRSASEAILKVLSVKTMQGFATATFVALSAWCLAGCAAHSPMIIKNTTDTHPISQSQYPPHHDK